MRALSIAATGMLAQQTNVEVIANNLANMNTTGFKEQRAEFEDLLYQNVEQQGTQSSDTGTICRRASSSARACARRPSTASPARAICRPPRIPTTWRSTGAGYFRIQMPDGTDAYTRAGNFALSPEGQLVTQQGYVVQPGIAIPTTATAVTINAQGQVQATIPGQTAAQTVGQLELTRFPNDAGLKAVRATICSPRPPLRARRSRAFPGPPATARSSRASWKPPTSTRWRRSRR